MYAVIVPCSMLLLCPAMMVSALAWLVLHPLHAFRGAAGHAGRHKPQTHQLVIRQASARHHLALVPCKTF